MDNKSYIAATLVQLFCIVFLVGQSVQRQATITTMESEATDLQDRLEDAEVGLESASDELGTCLRDGEFLQISLDTCTADLRSCGAWEVQRRYAADATY